MAEIDKLLRIAYETKASDLHLSAGEPVRMRIDGDLVAYAPEIRSNEDLQKLIFEILSEDEKARLQTHLNLDKSYGVEGCGFFRVNVLWTRRGIASVMRSIPFKIPTLEDLGLPPAVKKLSEAPKGLVLVTGPTGSGKSTTLAAMINYINTNFPLHILTAEDPVEFVHTSKQSLINQREIGANCLSFSDALTYALREDPDVILVGEMRDLETIGLALTAAETGHLVFGTLHTRGAGASVDRIIDSFPANQQAMIRTMLAESLVGVISQALLKRCDKGGRVAAFEILLVNHAISNLIREGKTFQMQSIMQTSRKDGMVLMEQNLLELVEKGIVTVEEAASHLDDPSQLLGKVGSSPKKSSAPSIFGTPAPTAPKMPLPNAAGAGAPPALGKPALPPNPAAAAKPSPLVKPAAEPPKTTPVPTAQPVAAAPKPAVAVAAPARTAVAAPAPELASIEVEDLLSAGDDLDVSLSFDDVPESEESPGTLDISEVEGSINIGMDLISEEDQVTATAMNIRPAEVEEMIPAPKPVPATP